MLPAGAVELRYVFSSASFEGVQLGNQLVAPVSVLDFYDTTPFQRRDRMHRNSGPATTGSSPCTTQR